MRFITLVVEVMEKESGKNIKIKNTANFPNLKKISKIFPGATYVSYPTGISAVAFTKVISKVKTSGVFPPEALDADIRKDILLELENNGIVMNEQFKSITIFLTNPSN